LLALIGVIGTWENSTGDSFKPPTNVTRLSRAISREVVIKEDGINKRISQIVYYQKGVGTGLIGDKLGGGKWLRHLQLVQIV
jgi:uncharacterized protein (DUF2235 family)